MSNRRVNPKQVRVNRDVLRDARKKAYETNNHGVIKFCIFLLVCTAIGGWGYVQYSSYQKQSLVVAPVPQEVQPLAEPEPITAIEPDLALNTPAAEPQTELPSEETVAAVELEPRVDHLSLDWITPSSRDVLLQIGRLDGYPESTEGPFSGEFPKEAVQGDVIRIASDRIETDFPQRILPGQAIVITFDEVQEQDLVFRALSVTRDKPGTIWDPTKDQPTLRILCNGQKIWDRVLGRQSHIVNALIPASYLESYKNTLTLQNTGKLSLVFDALWIEAFKPLQEKVTFHIRDWDHIPERYQSQFAWMRDPAPEKRLTRVPASNGYMQQYPIREYRKALAREEKVTGQSIGLWPYSNNFLALRQQEKVTLRFLENAVGWYFNGGRSLTLENVSGPGRFFCRYTGKLYPSAHALWLVSRLFEGKTPKRLSMNVLPATGEQRPLDQVYWIATENQDGVASIMVTKSRYGYIPGKKVRITCALPWRGTTKLSIHNGVFPEFVNMAKPTYRGVFKGNERVDDPNGTYDRNRQHEVRNMRIASNGKGGLLDIEMDIQDCLYIRLEKEGMQGIPKPDLTIAASTNQTTEPKNIHVAGGVSDARENNLIRSKKLPVYSAVLQSLSANYNVRMDAATKGNIKGQEYVVPETTQSYFCDIDYSQGASTTAEGATLSLYTFHESIEGKTLSFWVYPHATDAKRKIPLHMMLGSWQGQATLTPGQWQRVEVAFNDLDGEYERHMIILGPKEHQRAKDTQKITFEFNGIALLDAKNSGGRYIDVRQLSQNKLAFILLGEAGKPGYVRQSFPKSIAVKTLTNAPQANTDTDNPLKWVYKEESQMLEVNELIFPQETDSAILSYLNPKEREMCRQSGLVPVVLIAETEI